MSTQTKTCSMCGADKPLTEYYKAYTRADGSVLLMRYCKPCNTIRCRENRQAKPDAYRKTEREKMRRSRQTNPEYFRFYRIQRKYGLSKEEWHTLWTLQAGACGICEQDLSTVTKVCVDHDHCTGKVRGLLCNICNQGIGYFKDEPDRLRRAAAYLQRTPPSLRKARVVRRGVVCE